MLECKIGRNRFFAGPSRGAAVASSVPATFSETGSVVASTLLERLRENANSRSEVLQDRCREKAREYVAKEPKWTVQELPGRGKKK